MINAFGLQRVVVSGLACQRSTDEGREVEDRGREREAGVFRSLQPLALKGPDP